MTHTAALMSINHKEAKRREAEAKTKAESRKVSSETRAIRAAVLDRRDAKLDEAAAQAKAEQQAAPMALEATLRRATVAELSEISRMISRIDGRRLQALVDDIFREKSRTAYVAQLEPAETAQEAPPAPKASTSRRTRKRAS